MKQNIYIPTYEQSTEKEKKIHLFEFESAIRLLTVNLLREVENEQIRLENYPTKFKDKDPEDKEFSKTNFAIYPFVYDENDKFNKVKISKNEKSFEDILIQEANKGRVCPNEENCKERNCQSKFDDLLEPYKCIGKIRFNKFFVAEKSNVKNINYNIYGFLSKENYDSNGTDKKYHIYVSILDVKAGRVVATNNIWIKDELNDIDINILGNASEYYLTNINFKNSGLNYLLRNIVLLTKAPESATEKANKFTKKINAIRKKYENDSDEEVLKEFQSLENDIYIEFYGDNSLEALESKREININHYQTLLNLHKIPEASKKLKKVIQLSIEASINYHKYIKLPFFFQPNLIELDQETEEEIEESKQWLSNIAEYFKNKKNNYCLYIIGHSTKTGTSEYNQKLSLLRAKKIEELLKQQFPDIKSIAEGRGSTENIANTGTDDDFDIVDRRVELKVTNESCPIKPVINTNKLAY